MKICLVSEYYYPLLGGISEHIHHYSRFLIENGHDVTLLTSGKPGGPQDVNMEGLRVVSLGRSMPIYSNHSFASITVAPFLGDKVSRFYRENHFDLVHVHAALTPSLPLLSAKYARAPLVGTFHSYFEKSVFLQMFQGILQKALDQHQGLIAVAPSCIDSMKKYFRFQATIIPNGVDVNYFSKGRILPSWRNQNFRVLFLGRLDPRNGLDVLIHAFSLLKRKKRPVELLIAGDGPLRKAYMQKVPSNIRSQVHFLGPIRENRPDLFASVNLFCYPATKASFGITLLEAMASGTPVLASSITGFREIIQQGKNGFLVHPHTPQAWARALEQLIDSPSLRHRISDEGRNFVKQYSWEKVGQQILEYYDSLQAIPAVARNA